MSQPILTSRWIRTWTDAVIFKDAIFTKERNVLYFTVGCTTRVLECGLFSDFLITVIRYYQETKRR